MEHLCMNAFCAPTSRCLLAFQVLFLTVHFSQQKQVQFHMIHVNYRTVTIILCYINTNHLRIKVHFSDHLQAIEHPEKILYWYVASSINLLKLLDFQMCTSISLVYFIFLTVDCFAQYFLQWYLELITASSFSRSWMLKSRITWLLALLTEGILTLDMQCLHD